MYGGGKGVMAGMPTAVGSGGDIVIAPEGKKFSLKKILILVGVVVILLVGGIVGIMIMQGLGGVPREDVARLLEEHRGAVVFFEDIVVRIQNGDFAIPNIFLEETRELFYRNVGEIDVLCERICDESRIRPATDEENELFVVISVGVRERSETYRKYFLDNYGAFYDAFAVYFRESTVTDYERSEKVTALINSNNEERSRLAMGIDNYLSEMSDIVSREDALGCDTGLNYNECIELSERYSDLQEFILDRELTRGVFFGETESMLSEEFLGGVMRELLWMLNDE